MTTNELYAIAAVDLILGLIAFFICFCRAVVTDSTVLRRVRLKFVLLGPASLAFGLSPLWGDWPGLVNPCVLAAIVIGLLAETFQWGKGAPNSVKIDTTTQQLEGKDESPQS
jgi:hypothetical protein